VLLVMEKIGAVGHFKLELPCWFVIGQVVPREKEAARFLILAYAYD